MIWIVIGKMFINQSFTKIKAVINGETVQIWISQPRFTISKVHTLRDAAFGADCLTSFKILKITIVGLKNGFWYCHQELIHVAKIVGF